jgi:hypothetical protein
MRAFTIGGVLAVLALGTIPCPAAAATFQYTLDTSALVSLADLELDLQLIDGDGIANSTIVLSAFDFGGGSAMGSPSTTGGSSGTTASQVTLTDAAFLNAFTQGFVAGSSLAFSISLETSADAAFPDRFSVALLAGGLEVPTTGTADEILGVDLGGNPLSMELYGSDPNRTTIDLPPGTLNVASVPEASTVALLLAGTAAAIGRRRRPVGAAMSGAGAVRLVEPSVVIREIRRAGE